MNGDTIAWFLVDRASADNPDLAAGVVNVPRGTVFATRAEADAAVARASRDDRGRPNVIVAELVDRRTDAPTHRLGGHDVTTRELFGSRGITFRRRRWYLDRYARGSRDGAALPPWFAGWVTETPGNSVRVGVEGCGPRHGFALFHTGAS